MTKFITVLLLLLLPIEANAQWKKLQDFHSPVSSVFVTPGGIGFVGLWSGDVYRSINGGDTWNRQNVSGSDTYVTSFAFKDDKVGWFSSGFASFDYQRKSGYCYKTTDGGISWRRVTDEGLFVAVHYNAGTGLLFLSNWAEGVDASLVSSDEGETWMPLRSNSKYLNGYAFLSPNEGIVSALLGSGYLRTTDGGSSWSALPSTPSESWQPLALVGTSTYFAPDERSSSIHRSTDKGNTWRQIDFGKSTTGDIKQLANGNLVHQTTNDGLYLSSNLGDSWISIGGPSNELDSRIHSYCGRLFAGEIRGDHETGAIWAYDFDPGVSANSLPFALSGPQGERRIIVDVQGSTTIRVKTARDVLDGVAGTTIRFRLDADLDGLSATRFLPSDGWTMASNSRDANGFELVLEREDNGEIAKDSVIMNLEVTPILFANEELPVELRSMSGGCNALADASLAKVVLVQSPQCGDSTIRRFLRAKTVVGILSIRPNPSSTGIANVAFSLQEQAQVCLRVIDLNGSVKSQVTREFESGPQSHALDLGDLPPGTYHVILSTIYEEVTAKLVVH